MERLILSNIIVIISILLQIALKIDGKREECFGKFISICYLLVVIADAMVLFAGGLK